MKLFRTISLGLLASALAIGSAAAQDKTIKIATEGAYAPWNFTGAGGKLEGFEIDLAADLCARVKVKCEMVAQDWDGIIPALNAKKYDAIMAGMNITDKRLEVVAFTRPYASGMHGFATMKNSPLAKLAGTGERVNLDKDPQAAEKTIEAWKPLLKGKTVGTQGSTVNSQFLEKYLKDVVTIREYKTTEQHDLDLAAGRVDAIYAAHSSLQATLDQPEFKDMTIAGAGVSGGVLGRGVAVAVRKDDTELKGKFDAAIQSAIADGTIAKLTQKWFKVDMTPQG
ncbi:lysine/arginine/ornithine ABC transporter substrate-binding protein [Microvirga brassicacearum]|uniref:Transporter substrate-binding domain-containing protein n=1 Tax=Microvirga brassicacearum TaxID=2580413 RepID=A0A5N3P291_9HYPH|nr:lysine/arginine/ornithine ABC transporter substrate-binding protein [Microvirga brassicacearum]KAB0264084.1 transporter substrate-binding domain-containing protein [Microvirga brassicacearum]